MRPSTLFALLPIACAFSPTAAPARAPESKVIHVTEPGYNLPDIEAPAPLKTNSAGVYGLDHTHIWTADINRSIRFYTELLGFTVMKPVEDIGPDKWMQTMLGVPGASFRYAELNMPGAPSFSVHVPFIEIWEVRGVPIDTRLADNPGLNLQGKGYNSYRVKDLKAVAARLKAAGVRFVSEPIWDAPGHGGVYVLDPDGQPVELDDYRKAPGEK